MRALSQVMKALSDETRQRILGLLGRRECCVCEVMQVLGLTQPTSSRALGELYKAGIIRMRRDGRWVVYAIDREGMPESVLKIVHALLEALEQSPRTAADLARLEKTRRVGPRCSACTPAGEITRPSGGRAALVTGR
jgi:ArsR family transcriptional regulator